MFMTMASNSGVGLSWETIGLHAEIARSPGGANNLITRPVCKKEKI
jgi:hypothetical protein